MEPEAPTLIQKLRRGTSLEKLVPQMTPSLIGAVREAADAERDARPEQHSFLRSNAAMLLLLLNEHDASARFAEGLRDETFWVWRDHLVSLCGLIGVLGSPAALARLDATALEPALDELGARLAALPAVEGKHFRGLLEKLRSALAARAR